MLITFPFIYGDPAPGGAMDSSRWTYFTLPGAFVLIGIGAAMIVIASRTGRAKRDTG